MSIANKVIAFLKKIDRNMKISITTDKKMDVPYCVAISATVLGLEINTWGVDESLDTASTKAVMELYERFIFLNSKKSNTLTQLGFFGKTVDAGTFFEQGQDLISTTSSGYAAHISKKYAVDAAINELIERHVLLKAELLGIPPKRIAMSSNRFKCIDELKVDSFYWRGPLGRSIVTTRFTIKGLTFYGFGCCKRIESALEKSLLEVVPRLYYILNKNIDRIEDLPNENLHFYANLKSEESNMGKLLKLAILGSDSKAPEVDTVLRKSDFFISLVAEKPFPVVRAVSELVQPHFLGEWSIDKINLKAFNYCLPHNFPEGLHVLG